MKLTFTPYAWVKLQYLCHLGDTEVGAFAQTDPKDPLLVVDLHMPKQTCSQVTVDFDDESIADYFDRMVDAGHHPRNFSRIWVHTHPGESPNPSGTDETTFKKAFGKCDVRIMFILAKGGSTFCRLTTTTESGFTQSTNLPVVVDWEDMVYDDRLHDFDAWLDEYHANVTEGTFYRTTPKAQPTPLHQMYGGCTPAEPPEHYPLDDGYPTGYAEYAHWDDLDDDEW